MRPQKLLEPISFLLLSFSQAKETPYIWPYIRLVGNIFNLWKYLMLHIKILWQINEFLDYFRNLLLSHDASVYLRQTL